MKKDDFVITSLNRYERKKDIPLALKACKGLEKKAVIVIAGGYDQRVLENVEHHLELVNLAKKLQLQVVFLRSTFGDSLFSLNLLLETLDSLYYFLFNVCKAESSPTFFLFLSMKKLDFVLTGSKRLSFESL